jgi:hypothetical protein
MEKEIGDLAEQEGFEILWIKEEDEEPVTLFLVSTRKMSKVYAYKNYIE